MILLGYIIAFLYAILCIFVAFCLNKLGIGKKYTRKIVHISIGLEWLILYHFMGESFHFLIVCLTCFALLLFDYKLHLISALSSDGDNAPGTVYYGLAMSIMSAISLVNPSMLLPFGIGVTVTSLGDGMAGVIGQLTVRYNRKIYKNKTLVGSLSFIVFSFVGVLLFKYAFAASLNVWQVLLISVFAAALELISARGLDNITITLGSAFLAYSLMYLDGTVNYLVPIILTPIVIAIVLSKRVLTPVAVVFAVLLDALVSIAFGNAGFIVLLTFLFLSVVSDKVKARGRGSSTADDKTSLRGGVQVIANGAVPAVCSLLFIFTKNPVFTLMYIASVAEAFADTAASGVGALSDKTYDPFRLKTCENGISGGMSLLGTVASLVASFVITLISFALGMIDIKGAIILALIAFLGMIFDSALGSLLQIKYKCTVCGRITEKKEHCEASTVKYRGVSFVNNDVVNITASVFTAILALIISL